MGKVPMNNKGKGSGLALILILIVALIIAYLAVTRLSSLGVGSNNTQTRENPVEQAQNVVESINQKQGEAGQAP